MRFLFATRPFVGHLFPMIPLAIALRDAGHDVVIASAPSLEGAVHDAGLPFAAAGRELARAHTAGLEDVDQYHSSVIGLETRDLLAHAPTYAPDVIVREPTDFAGLLAAEALGRPHVTLGRSQFLSAATWLEHLGDSLDVVRAELGLPGDPLLEDAFRYLYLDMVPPLFQRFERPPIDTLVPIRPAFYDGAEATPAIREDGPRATTGRPRVYVTLGTVYNRAPQFFRTVSAAAAGLGMDVLCTVGPNQDPGEVVPFPEAGVRVERFVPQSRVLAGCSAVVSHGGYSTVVAALCAGVPVVIVPYGSDHHGNAHQCERLGVGLMIDPRELTVHAVQDALTAVLEQPSFREAAVDFRDSVAALPGLDHAVELLERTPARLPTSVGERP